MATTYMLKVYCLANAVQFMFSYFIKLRTDYLQFERFCLQHIQFQNKIDWQ